MIDRITISVDNYDLEEVIDKVNEIVDYINALESRNRKLLKQIENNTV